MYDAVAMVHTLVRPGVSIFGEFGNKFVDAIFSNLGENVVCMNVVFDRYDSADSLKAAERS